MRSRGETKKVEARARSLIRRYLAVRDQAKRLGILRADRTLQSDYAEWLVAKRLGLRLASNPIQAGYDATDQRGRGYQIKSRVVRSVSSPTAFDFRTLDHPFDCLLGVFLSAQLTLLGVIKVPGTVVREVARKNRGSFRHRWSRSSSSDQRIEKLFWSVTE